MAARKPRKYLVASALLVVVAVAACAWLLTTSRPRIRNVLLISIDTCRADHLSCYGYEQRTTPNIDALARTGVLFENAISAVPLTLPAHSSMLTGTIPPYHGVHQNIGDQLDDSLVSLPEILRDVGFATAAAISAYVLDSQHGLDQGFEVYDDTFSDPLEENTPVERRGGDTTELALDWIDRNKDRRFFYFLHYYDPHDDYEPPEPFASTFSSNPYAGEIAYTDHCIGRVVQTLRDLQLYDSTLIIIVGDHGEMLGEHGEPTHAFFIYQSAIRIPMIFKLPGRDVPARVPALVGLVDIVPTVCSLLGVTPPPDVQGIDLSAYCTSKDTRQPERHMYCESFYPTFYGTNPLVGVVTNRFKFIRTTRSELYDLVRDPAESNNLLEEEGGRARILRGELDAILDTSLRHTSRQRRVPEDGLRRLQSLGYVGRSNSDSFAFDPANADPKDTLGFHLLAEQVNSLVLAGQFHEAKGLVEEMIRQKPDHVMGYSKMSIILAELGDYRQAIHYGERAADLDPGDALTYAALGRLHDTIGETDRAVEYYRRSLAIDPQDAVVQHSLGRALLARKAFAEAAECFRRALRIRPDFPEALTDLGNACRAQGRLDQAIQYYQQVLELDPTAVSAHYNLGNALKARGAPEEGITHYRLAIRHDPNHTKSYNNLAWLLATDPDAPYHDPDEAVILARTACEIAEYGSHELLDLLAIAHAAAGDFPEAIQAAQEAIRIAELKDEQSALPSLRTRLQLFRKNRPYQP